MSMIKAFHQVLQYVAAINRVYRICQIIINHQHFEVPNFGIRQNSGDHHFP